MNDKEIKRLQVAMASICVCINDAIASLEVIESTMGLPSDVRFEAGLLQNELDNIADSLDYTRSSGFICEVNELVEKHVNPIADNLNAIYSERGAK